MAITGSSVSQLAQAPIEVAVRAALLARGHRFDNEDVLRATTFVMTSLSPDTLRAIAANPTGSSHLLQAVIPSATAQLTTANRVPWNWHGPARDPTRFGTGRTWAGQQGAGLFGATRSSGDGDDDGPVVRTSYGPLNTRWDASRPYELSDHNWHSSPFHGIAGLDIPTARSLLAAGFAPSEIVRAGRDVERLAQRFGSDHRGLITTPENIARATRLNREAPEFMNRDVPRFNDALAGIRESEGGIARDEVRLREMESRGEGNSEGATALRADIARRQEEGRRKRQEAETQMSGAIQALPEHLRSGAEGLVGGIRAADAAALAATAEQARLAAQRQAEEAAARAAREQREREAAERNAVVADLLGPTATSGGNAAPVVTPVTSSPPQPAVVAVTPPPRTAGPQGP